ncbi:hypothetical protein [Methanomethylophilus alvi]|uniref:hypothetical protein n=1 Tax=Methanomethylophilus alvi TaxID=1291540 RepID=UPI0037DDADBB
MESLCINQFDQKDKVAPCRLNDYLNGKLTDKVSPTPIFLNYDHNITLEEGRIAIWEWSNGVWAKESESSKQLCEIIRITATKSKDEKALVRNLRKKLKEGIKPKQHIDSRWNLFVIHNSKEKQGVLLEPGQYTYENGIVKIVETKDALQYCPIYRIPDEDLIKSNGAMLLEKRREFTLTTDLVLTDSSIVIKEADEIALYFLDKYKNLITKHSRGQTGLAKVIDQLLHTEPLKSRYPDNFDIEQFFKDEDVSSTLETRLVGNDPDAELINSFLKSNPTFTKSCEDKIYKEVVGKHKKEIAKFKEELKKVQGNLKAAQDDLKAAESLTKASQNTKESLDKEIKDLQVKKTAIQSDVDSIADVYSDKKKACDSELEAYQKTILEKKASLDAAIETLTAEISALKASKEALENEKQAFLATFGTSTLNESILPLLVKEIAKCNDQQVKLIVNELKNLKTPSEPLSTPTVTSQPSEPVQKNYLLIPSTKSPSAKKCDIEDIEDSLEDNLIDCGMNPKSAGELASYIQAAILCKRSIIVCGDRSDCIPNSISNSILGSTCTRILYTGNDPLEILNVVSGVEDSIVAIDGILNNLDYNAYFTLNKYVNKRLIFFCNDLKMLQAAPMEIWSSSILIDLTKDVPIRGAPAHPTVLSTGKINAPKSTRSDVVKSTLNANAINHNVLIAGISDYLLRLGEYDSSLSITYLKYFLEFLSKVSELNNDE